jgi:DNA polymerase III alpha subunit (gram-positive type)
MPENRKNVSIIEVHYTCDECGVGELLPTGVVFPTYPMRYEHKCDHCGAKETFSGRTYPRTEYHEID